MNRQTRNPRRPHLLVVNWVVHKQDVNVRGWEPALEPPTQPSPILRKINFLIWDQIWPTLGYVQAIGVLRMRFWALFDVSTFYLFRQVWSLTNPWPCSNLGFPRSIFIFFARKHPPWLIEHGYAKNGGCGSSAGSHPRTLIYMRMLMWIWRL